MIELSLIRDIVTIAGVFIALSYLLDPNFIVNYLNYGSELGAVNPIGVKYSGLFAYYGKIFRQSSGTYYTPNIRGELIVFQENFLGY